MQTYHQPSSRVRRNLESMLNDAAAHLKYPPTAGTPVQFKSDDVRKARVWFGGG
jgi:hypothetical protein